VSEASTDSTTGTEAPQPGPSNWIGWIIFAAMVLILLGIFQATAGLVAILDENYFQATGNAPVFLAVDQQTWGILQLVVGGLVILTATGLLAGRTVARVVTCVVVLACAVLGLLGIGAYPLWSTVLLTLCVLVLYAITVHGGEMRPAR
jgi:hypothetical protein